ncbi:MAG: glycosyltransferase family 2 protein [Acidimicrobiia bacterium]|nr:glycosyltransferase family 2 protein [Acidimicrobiia bacterium]
MKILGVIMAYNEADIVAYAARSLIGAEFDEVHLFDHGSSDATIDAAREAGIEHVHHIKRSVPFQRVWPTISSWINKQALNFEWVVWQAADEVLRPPEDVPLHRSHIERAAGNRYRVIEPKMRLYWPNVADDPAEPDIVKRLRHYRWVTSPIRHSNHIPRCWEIGLTGGMPRGLHRRPSRWAKKAVRINRNNWILEHRPIRTEEQGRQKVLKDRRPQPGHPQDQYRKLRKRLVRDDERIALPFQEGWTCQS